MNAKLRYWLEKASERLEKVEQGKGYNEADIHLSIAYSLLVFAGVVLDLDEEEGMYDE